MKKLVVIALLVASVSTILPLPAAEAGNGGAIIGGIIAGVIIGGIFSHPPAVYAPLPYPHSPSSYVYYNPLYSTGSSVVCYSPRTCFRQEWRWDPFTASWRMEWVGPLPVPY